MMKNWKTWPKIFHRSLSRWCTEVECSLFTSIATRKSAALFLCLVQESCVHRGTAGHRQRRRALCLRCLCLWVATATPTLLAPMPVHRQRQACAPGWAGHRKGNRRRPGGTVLYWPEAFNAQWQQLAVQYSTAVVSKYPSNDRRAARAYGRPVFRIREGEKPAYTDEGVAAEEAVDEPGGAAQEHGQGEQERHELHALRLDHQPLHTRTSTCLLIN